MTITEHIQRILKKEKKFNSKGFALFDTWSQVLLQIVYEYMSDLDSKTYPSIEGNKEQIYKDILQILYHSKEPSFVLGPYWHYAPICNALVLIAKKENLYCLFSKSEKERMHQLMKMFAYNWNLGCNTYNNYGTGVDLVGNYGKWRGPNYRLANIGLIFPIMSYFDGENNLNDLFLNYDYDREIKNILQFQFRHILKAWTTETIFSREGKKILGAKDLTTFGGTAYIQSNQYGVMNTYWRGTGQGVKIPYAFKDNYPYGIIHFLYNNCFDGKECLSNVKVNHNFSSYIQDGTISPFEGQDGMMLEFNLENDGQGVRTSLFYCSIDFSLMVQLITVLQLLNISKLKDYKNLKKVWTGMEDYIYKKEHGYVGYRLGHVDHFNPKRSRGLNAWIDYWKNNYRPLVGQGE